MTFLLDVNVLIALIDPGYVQHDTAYKWFSAKGKQSWATRPATQNGVLRIVGQTRYPNSPGTPAAVWDLMHALVSLPGHTFWPDDVSLLDDSRVDAARLLTSAQVTGTYLLALAMAHKGRLATFDRRLVADAVHDGPKALHLIA